MNSPFQFGKIVEGSAFTDRESDIQRLVLNFENRLHTILISPRRWGKSSLVKRASRVASRNHTDMSFCFIDLFNIRNEREFYAAYARELIKSTSNKVEEWVSLAQSFLNRIRPRFSFGTDPITDFSIQFDLDTPLHAVDDVLELSEKIARKKKINIVVCLDEFQNLAHFEEPELFQKRLRSVWQHHQRVAYCLYGSKRSMLARLFEHKSMPFYKFGDVFYLDKIDIPHWRMYIMKQFRKTGKSIPSNLAVQIAEWMHGHPYYVQQFSHMVWITTSDEVNENILNAALDDLIHQNSSLFEKDMEGLSNTQVNFLRALSEGVNQSMSSSDILLKYQLGTSANVVKIKKALENKEIIEIHEGKPVFVDPAFELWLKRIYIRGRNE